MENIYLKRTIDAELIAWKEDPNRKPLMIRGARQVGKSSTVREFSKTFEYYIEINFEEQRNMHKLFTGDLSPERICEQLSLYTKTPINPGKTLLFFDEIQACTEAISSLRFFYEKMPGLHLIAAGSLLEFALEALPSFGVGRIRTLFMYPFSFDEFLLAQGEEALLNLKNTASAANPLPDLIHQKLCDFLKRFLLIGGMPEVMGQYIQSHDLLSCQRILDDLITSLQADFAKYKKRVPPSRLAEVFLSAAKQTGSKFVYSVASPESNHKQTKEALGLLIMSGLLLPVTHSSAHGIPLGAEMNLKKRKMLVFDTGIYQRLLGLDLSEILFEKDTGLINKGALAELFVGLELAKYGSCYRMSELFYWQREAKNSLAEVDYLLQRNLEIIPVEVKSGTRGAMQSMYRFLEERHQSFGFRISLENFSEYKQIRVVPMYAVRRI
jgi:uncharacterized protein